MNLEQPPFPEDPEFQKFAADIADAVLWAESRGFRIVPLSKGAYNSRCCCPLGARELRNGSGRPRYPSITGQLGFASCFDRDILPHDAGGWLGRMYRLRAKQKGLA